MAPRSVAKLDQMRERLIHSDRDRGDDRGAGRGPAAADVARHSVRARREIYDGVRARSAFLDDDRSLAPDFEAVAGWIDTGAS